MPVVKKEKSLSTVNPVLASEWNYRRNKGLTPRHITFGSKKKVWWICKNGHEWRAEVKLRKRGTRCPYCLHKAASPDYCLSKIDPALAKEWHPQKNGALTPKDVTPGSHKKVWWMCSKGHEWEAGVLYRWRGSGCPGCFKERKRIPAKSGRKGLATVNPALAKEWHPQKNGALTPKDVTTSSKKKVWWICSKGHEWRTNVFHRNRGTGCPMCSQKAASPEYCLLAINPTVAKEWHPFKNGVLSSATVTPGSSKKVWWRCSRGHEWQAKVNHRNRGSRCPKCRSASSKNISHLAK